MSVEQNAIYVIDELVARPGQGKALHDAYMQRYAPGARERGMVLAHRLVEPAMWLPEGVNRLLFIWTQPDVGAVWGAKQRARLDPDVDRWWQEEAPALVETRQRYTLAEAEALGELDNV
ncbi:hypothetical protein [Sphingobium estronivorans]|uniref:hypothetical protein n=1 Tax=Sphingobium estronivorans TaxID=1577690 RepID=UPI00123B7313|nr:hypothetical protein [Sphingobium estronivorans]